MKQKLLHLVYIVVGNILIAFALSTLLLENHIIAGGVSGIGIVLNHYFGLSISMSVGLINVVLFLLGLSFLGKSLCHDNIGFYILISNGFTIF